MPSTLASLGTLATSTLLAIGGPPTTFGGGDPDRSSPQWQVRPDLDARTDSSDAWRFGRSSRVETSTGALPGPLDHASWRVPFFGPWHLMSGLDLYPGIDPCDCAPPEGDARGPDSDRDGLSDALEVRTGTDPSRADSDRDGVPDGLEDRDGDGRVDAGESDPRAPGLFPGRYPHIPEPMTFDLVRGLRSRRGELETNALVVTTFDRGRAQVEWSPEVEWAFADGHAIEGEIRLAGDRLDAFKVAMQGSMASRGRGGGVHGWQLMSETELDERRSSITQLYLGGFRVRRYTQLWMAGGRFDLMGPEGAAPAILVNLSNMVDVHERVTTGVEMTFDGPLIASPVGLRVIPQAHVQISQRFRLQFGGGYAQHGLQAGGILAFRIVVE